MNVPTVSRGNECVYKFNGLSDPVFLEATLSTEFARSLGLESQNVSHLISMNDDGHSFEKIADWIEKNL